MSTDTDTPAAGGNSRQAIVAYAERMTRLLDDKLAVEQDIKALKEEMKGASFGKDEMKAFAQCVKELRRGPDYQSDQLQLELILDTYRQAVGLPTDLEVAQQRALAEAETAPDDKPRRKRRSRGEMEDAITDPALEGTAVSFDGDSTYHDLGPGARGGKKRRH